MNFWRFYSEPNSLPPPQIFTEIQDQNFTSRETGYKFLPVRRDAEISDARRRKQNPQSAPQSAPQLVNITIMIMIIIICLSILTWWSGICRYVPQSVKAHWRRELSSSVVRFYHHHHHHHRHHHRHHHEEYDDGHCWPERLSTQWSYFKIDQLNYHCLITTGCSYDHNPLQKVITLLITFPHLHHPYDLGDDIHGYHSIQVEEEQVSSLINDHLSHHHQ